MAKRSTAVAGPFQRVPVTKVVQPYIRQHILSNNLRPGDPLPSEAELAETLQVSRVSVRESVKALEALGVIQVIHGKGLFVRSFNLDAALEVLSYSLDFGVSTVYELYQIRKWLEIAVIGDVAAKIDEAALAKLDRLLNEWEANIPAGTWAEFDRRFHRVLCSRANNQMLLLVLDAFWTVFDNATDESLKATPDPWATLADHRRILDAVRLHDGEAARKALIDSYEAFENRYREAPREDEQGAFVLRSQT